MVPLWLMYVGVVAAFIGGYGFGYAKGILRCMKK